MRTIPTNTITTKSKRVPNGYWNEDTIVKELTIIINNINHFPKQSELVTLNRSDLSVAISRNGATNKYREIMGYKSLHVIKGHWTNKTLHPL